MKFLLIIPSSLRGGVEEYSLRIATAAVAQGWEVHAAFPKVQGTGSLITDFVQQGIHYHPLGILEPLTTNGLLRLSRSFWHFLLTLPLLQHIKPDVVQLVLPAPYSCMGSIIACGFLRVPALVRFGLISRKQNFSPFKIKLYAWARGRCQQWAAVSEDNRKLICQSFQIPNEQVICLYNGTRLSTILDQEKARDQYRQRLRAKLNLSQESKLLLTVGRLSEQKGYRDLVSIIPSIIQKFPEVRFLWVGDSDGHYRTHLVEQLKKAGVIDQVLLLGYRSDVPQLLVGSDLFIFPTHYEGHPSALMEAMAHGLPIVTSDASSIPEILEHGKQGLLFHKANTQELQETLLWALGHPEDMQIMARNALAHIQSFSLEKMFTSTFEILEKLA